MHGVKVSVPIVHTDGMDGEAKARRSSPDDDGGLQTVDQWGEFSTRGSVPGTGCARASGRLDGWGHVFRCTSSNDQYSIAILVMERKYS